MVRSLPVRACRDCTHFSPRSQGWGICSEPTVNARTGSQGMNELFCCAWWTPPSAPDSPPKETP